VRRVEESKHVNEDFMAEQRTMRMQLPLLRSTQHQIATKKYFLCSVIQGPNWRTGFFF
jgi:hypothetical protein